MSEKERKPQVPLSEIVLTPEEEGIFTPEFLEKSVASAMRYVEERTSTTESPEFSVSRTKPAK